MNTSVVGEAQVRDIVARHCPADRYQNKSVLLIIPDGTRTAPVGLLFRALFDQLGDTTRRFDILVALGTHQPMSEIDLCRRLEISREERASTFRKVAFYNHEWDNPSALQRVGTLEAAEISELTTGRFTMDVPVEVNRLLYAYDQIIIVGPVFPHEVVGFSGGNKYLFPGVSGPEILNFFHWLGAVVSNPKIIGHAWTPVRKVVDRAAALVKVDKLCFAMVVHPASRKEQAGVAEGPRLAGLFAGTPESAWEAASRLSAQLHIVRKARPFHTIISCAPRMYDELWTAGKCMYKLEPVLADDGELVIYAPHLEEICVTHGHHIRAVGYHCRDYFLKQWDRFQHYPWGVLAHSTHVRGIGCYENGVERCRARVTLATRIPPEVCREINLGYRDPQKVELPEYAQREDEGVLVVPHAGEMLFRLETPPAWSLP